MNFLAHFFFDGKANAPYFNMGLVLPDLMGISERGWKIHALPDTRNLAEASEALKKGIQFHHKMDHFFHNSDFFRDATKHIKQTFRERSIGAPDYRLFFVSHIFLELMMDRLIVKADPCSAHRFYEELNKVEYDCLADFFGHTTVELKQHFRNFLQRFLNSKYVLNYTDDQSFVYALNRIFERVGQPVFEEHRLLRRLNDVIFEVENHIEACWFEFEQELKAHRIDAS